MSSVSRAVLLIACIVFTSRLCAQGWTTRAQLGYTIVSSFPSPDPDGTGDICVHGAQLFIGDPASERINVVNKNTGVLEDVILTSLLRVGGLTCDGTYLWAAESINDGGFHPVLRIDPVTHQELAVFSIAGGEYAHGMCYHNGQLWINMFTYGVSDTTKVFDLSGNLIEQHPNGQLFSHGIDFHNGDPWISANTLGGASSAIYRFDPLTFTPLDTMDVPGGNYPNGVAWDDFGLWVAEAGGAMIYLIVPDPYVGVVDPGQSQNDPFEILMSADALTVTAPELVEVVVVDPLGRVVLRQPATSGVPVPARGLSAGNYIVQGICRGGRLFAKAVHWP